MKRLFIILAACLIGIVNVSTAFAEGADTHAVYFTDHYTVEDAGETRINYDFINPVELTIESTDTGKIEVELNVNTYETMEKLGFTNLKVQRWSGTSWVTDREVTSNYVYTTNSYSYHKSFTGLSSGYQYRVKVTLRAKRAPGEVQDMTITSDNILCH